MKQVIGMAQGFFFFHRQHQLEEKTNKKNSEKNSASLFVLKRTDVHVGL